jgi:type IV pilus assembly protein PilE
MKINRKGLVRRLKGFSLIELMIVIGVIALLVGLAIPSYKQFVRKANRGEAQQLLMNWANLQEIWRSNHTTYAVISNDPAVGIAAPTHDLYTFTLAAAPTATSYSLVATGVW